MKLIYTKQALNSLQEVLDFVSPNISTEKLIEIRKKILDAADTLIKHPQQGQSEPLLERFGLNHRRLIVSHYKIIYRIVGENIYITDIFDSRQDPEKMKV